MHVINSMTWSTLLLPKLHYTRSFASKNVLIGLPLNETVTTFLYQLNLLLKNLHLFMSRIMVVILCTHFYDSDWPGDWGPNLEPFSTSGMLHKVPNASSNHSCWGGTIAKAMGALEEQWSPASGKPPSHLWCGLSGRGWRMFRGRGGAGAQFAPPVTLAAGSQLCKAHSFTWWLSLLCWLNSWCRTEETHCLLCVLTMGKGD